MSLAPTKKKRIIIIIIILSVVVRDLLDGNTFDSPQEQVLRKVGQAESILNAIDEANWSSAHSALWNVMDGIAEAHSPEALNDPTTEDYEQWVEDLDDALNNL